MSIDPVIIAPFFPLWLILLFLGLGLALVIAQYRMTWEKIQKSRALALSLLRLGMVFLLIAITLNPSLLFREEQKISPTAAILLDTSASMGQPGSSEESSRLDEARALLTGGESPLLRSLMEKFEVGLYGLGDTLRPLDAGSLVNVKAGGDKGDVNEAFKQLREKYSLAILLSDGNVRWNEGSGQQIPTITIPVGNPKEYRDVLIKAIKAPALGFRGREIVIDVMIKSYGYEGVTVPVLLKDSEQLLTAKTVTLPEKPGETAVALSFIPNEAGKKTLSVSIPQQAGEKIVTNNETHLSIKVVRDKTRIVMVSGTPSVNYRFIRNALKLDPSIDLLSFVILRSPSDILNVRNNEMSLIPLPVDTLFSKELSNFDLLIFENFNYTLFLTPAQLESIRSFVKEGGGFAMIGGPNLFNEGRDGLSPVGDILPFRFVQRESYTRDSPIGVKPSQAGERHPVTHLFEELHKKRTDRLRFWQDMPPLDGINLLEAKKTSTVLLTGDANGIPWPILMVSDYEKGRTLALATDYAWKWNMGMVAQGKGNQAYLRFFHRMVRWLTKDPSLDPVQMILPEMSVSAGQGTDMRMHLQGEDASRVAVAALSVSVLGPDGIILPSQIKPTPQTGEYLISFVPERGGVYYIKAETPIGSVEEAMVVAGPLDHLDAAPDHEQLKKISLSTEGEYSRERDQLSEILERYALKTERSFIEEKRQSLWATPWMMALVLGVLSFEWYLRRRWGLL